MHLTALSSSFTARAAHERRNCETLRCCGAFYPCKRQREQWVGLQTRRGKIQKRSSESRRYDAVLFISGQLELPLAEIGRLRKMSRAVQHSGRNQERISETSYLRI